MSQARTKGKADSPAHRSSRGLSHGYGGHSHGRFSNNPLLETEVETIIEKFAEEDANETKTWTRLIVENFLSKYSWYFPPRKDRPSLSKAYAFYEHITLPRRLKGDQTADHIFRRAEVAENEQETELYSPFTTPASCFIEWGIGIDLYFTSVRYMAIILFIAGLINVSNIIFYRSSKYSPNGQSSIRLLLQGSAICTTQTWVVCSDCNPDDPLQSYGVAENGAVLAQKNDCRGGEMTQGMVNYATFFFLVLVLGTVSYYLNAREIRFDEDKVTSTDYSVCVTNPPPDAFDPDEWKDFFDQFAEKQVTVVSIALNNEFLLRKLVSRRTCKNELRRMLPKGVDMNDEDEVRVAVAQLVQEQESEQKGCIDFFLERFIYPILRLAGLFLKPDVLVNKVFALTEEIKELQKEKYTVSNVFVTFETEEGQRTALSALSVGKLDIMRNKHESVSPSAIFKDRVLHVVEPAESSAIRWLDLAGSGKKTKKYILQFFTCLFTLGLVAVCGYLVYLTRESSGVLYSGVLTIAFNAVIPEVIKLLMLLERHDTEGDYQNSLYLKITLFRWINTAILPLIISPFVQTLSSERSAILPTILGILLSELWLAPAIRILDIVGNINKHIISPRARNQELMNLGFQGTSYNLGERYTDLTKILFLCFFYSALCPSTFFFGAAILIVQYFTDKYCLMRIWGQSPLIGSKLARSSWRYFLSGALVVFALVSAYFWAQFPFDNLCEPVNATTGAAGFYPNVVFQSDSRPPENITVTQNAFFSFCDQDQIFDPGFPPTPKIQQGLKWMSSSQERLTTIYGWTSVVVLVVYIVAIFGTSITTFFFSWFRGVYQSHGQSQKIDFSSNTEVFAYVPSVKVDGFPFPLLACNIDKVDQDLVWWKDLVNSGDFQSLIFDIPYINMPHTKVIEGKNDNQKEYARTSTSEENVEIKQPKTPPIFATVKHYPPKWQIELRKQARQ